LLLFPALLLGANAAEPWDHPFTADTAALLKRANQLTAPEEQEVQVLLEEHLISVKSGGRVHATMRKVYRILTKDAVEDWSSVEQSYQPWREQKPEIRARVITRAGSIHALDPKTIADSPAAELESNVFSDTRVVRAPLPAVEPGAVVEYEIATDAGPAFPDSGVTRRIQVMDNVPLERFHLAIDAPAGAPLQTVYGQMADSATNKTSSKTGTRIECELGPFKPRKAFEGSLPPDVSPFPYLTFSTAPGWSTLAARYAEIVDRQIRSADVKAIVDGPRDNEPPLTTVARLATELHRKVRYTGVEFGEAAVVPAAPSDVLQRRYGDCKDKASLMVAMLRAAGLRAYVALLRASYGHDVDPSLPGLDLFDHAIVYVDGPQPLWIDATANDFRAGVLPTQDQGRLALIARSGTVNLVKIPEQTDTLDRREYTVQFKDFGSGSITEVMESNGPSEAYLRSAYAANENAKTVLQKYVKSAYAARRLGTYEIAGKDDLSQPVRVTAQAVETPQVVTDMDSASVLLGATLVIRTLPYELQTPLDEDSGEPDAARKNDFFFQQAGVTERVFKLHPPTLYRVGSLPPSSRMDFGPLTLSQTFKTAENGAVEADFRLEIPRRRITAAEFEAARAALLKHRGQFQERISFVPETAELLAVGETSKALALVRENAAKHDADASAHVRLSRVLLSVGLGIPGRMEAERATQLDPKSPQAWQALAWTWQNDTFGRLRQGDWNRAEALKALRKALELDPDDVVAKMDLAILLEFNERGERYGKNIDEKESIALYRELLKKQPNPIIESNLTAALFYDNQLEEARAEAHKCLDNQRILFEALIQALQRGAAPAIVGVQTQVPDATTRAQFLANIGFTLIHLRRYPDALTFFQASVRATAVPQATALLQLFSGLKRSEEAMLPETDPRSVEQKVLMLLFTEEKLSREKLDELLTFVPKTGDWENEEIESARRMALAGFQQLVDLGLTRENLVDMMLSKLELNQDGDDAHGYRISGKDIAAMLPTMFVVRQGDRYKIIGSKDSMEDIGRKVLDLLKKNDVEIARWWLDHAIPDIPDNPDGWMPAAHAYWPGTKFANRGLDAARLAAASIIAHYEGSADALAILKEAYAKAANAIDKAQIDQAFCEAYAKSKQWPLLAASGKRLMVSPTFHEAGFEFLVQALEEQKDWKALDAAALEETKKKDPSRHAWRHLAIARIASGNAAGATEAIDHLKSSTDGEDLAAWNDIRRQKVSQRTVDAMKKADGATEVRNPYLLALLELHLKKTAGAQDALKQAIQNVDAKALDARAWVVYGGLCQQYGFPDAARQAWERARSAKAATREAQWALAAIDGLAR